jgi:DNA (cytosine-5)-methyltransferase 1
MRYLSVCSGIEAASCAWPDWTPVAFSEIEPFPCAVLAHHYPDTPNWGDMTKFKEWPDADVNVLVGGTPCQSFSVAGLRKGLADPRGNLMLTYLAIADRYRPTWVVWENVHGVLSSNGGRDFGTFLGGLGELGYGFAYRILDAQYFGVAQRRRRVFVVGCLGSWQRAAAVLFERDSLQGHPAPSRKTGEKSTAPLRNSTPSRGGQGSDAEHTVMMLKDVAPCLDAMMDKKRGSNQWVDSGQFVFCAFDGQKNASISDNLAPTLTKQDEQPYITTLRLQRKSIGLSWQKSLMSTTLDKSTTPGVAYEIDEEQNAQEELMGTLKARTAGGGFEGSVAFDLAQITSKANRTRVDASLPASTLNADGQMHMATTMQVRRLTPVECERLQGFPDGYTNVPHRNKPAADGPRYKSLGNSMAVPVMAWIGKRIQMVETALAHELEAA